jgi:general secretion pathway protein N
VADQLRPLTLLLGAVCLWALSVLVMALAGLGSQVPTASGAAAPPPLPTVTLTRSESRLGPFAQYAEVAQRPLLNQDRRPSLAPVEGEGSGDLDVVLTSVLITPTLQMAIFTDNKDASSRRARLGELVTGSNWRLAVLEPRRAVLEGPTGQRELVLRVFDGKGGQPPTPVADGAGVQNGDGNAVRDANALPPPPPSPTPTPLRPAAIQPERNDSKPDPSAAATMTQEQQVEAIRRRIEARRAQMRAEAAATAREK